MTKDLWRKIMTGFDEEMKKQNRKILLFIDNATSHTTVKDFENIKLCFMPPNTTALLQPLDQGIIHSFKLEYRRILVKQQLIAVNCGKSTVEFLKSLSLLDALYFVNQGWKNVKMLTIQNCFKR